jgi:signal transduction histidine kinase
VGNIVRAMGNNLNYGRTFWGDHPPRLLERLDEALNQVEQVSDRIRDVMSELRPMVLDDYGLPGALQWYAEQFSRRTGIKVAIHEGAAMRASPTRARPSCIVLPKRPLRISASMPRRRS